MDPDPLDPAARISAIGEIAGFRVTGAQYAETRVAPGLDGSRPVEPSAGPVYVSSRYADDIPPIPVPGRDDEYFDPQRAPVFPPPTAAPAAERFAEPPRPGMFSAGVIDAEAGFPQDYYPFGAAYDDPAGRPARGSSPAPPGSPGAPDFAYWKERPESIRERRYRDDKKRRESADDVPQLVQVPGGAVARARPEVRGAEGGLAGPPGGAQIRARAADAAGRAANEVVREKVAIVPVQAGGAARRGGLQVAASALGGERAALRAEGARGGVEAGGIDGGPQQADAARGFAPAAAGGRPASALARAPAGPAEHGAGADAPSRGRAAALRYAEPPGAEGPAAPAPGERQRHPPGRGGGRRRGPRGGQGPVPARGHGHAGENQGGARAHAASVQHNGGSGF